MAHAASGSSKAIRRSTMVMIIVTLAVAALVPALLARSHADEPVSHPHRRLVVTGQQAAPAPAQRPRGQADEPDRGLVYAGLGHSRQCPGGFVLEGTADVCTHGPDGVGSDHGSAGRVEGVTHDHSSHDHGTGAEQDVRNVPSTSTLLEAAGELASGGTSTDSGQIPCYGDGISGPRVQTIYAVASDRTDRYSALLDTFPVYAARANATFANTAAASGAIRNIRFVHTTDCRLDVLHVVLSPTGDDSFANTVSELRALGLTRTDRKYLVWVDAGMYCGIATVVQDESSGSGNRANLGPTFARVDSACWGSTQSVEAHEIAHTLGAVQLGAPNSNGAWHCTDEYDRLCYNDGSGATMQFVCPSGVEALLDCGGNDYFNVSPAPNSYLANHWNLADSAFLSSSSPGSSDPQPDPTPTATTSLSPSPTPTTTLPPNGPTKTTMGISGSLNRKQSARNFPVTVSAGSIEASITISKGKSMRLSIVDSAGNTLAGTTGNGTIQVAVDAAPSGSYAVRVDGSTSGSFNGTAVYWS
jgi:hypothetical protein